MGVSAAAAERFWSNVEKTGTCWLWAGSKTQGGYGQARFGGRTAGAHRIAYTLLVGPIPNGLEIDHLCRVRACVNPAHLEPVTHTENVRRWAATITHCKYGHELTSDNLIPSHPNRACLTCNREQDRARYAARKAARAAA